MSKEGFERGNQGNQERSYGEGGLPEKIKKIDKPEVRQQKSESSAGQQEEARKELERMDLLAEVSERGRLISETPIGRGAVRGNKYEGYQTITDSKPATKLYSELLEKDKESLVNSTSEYFLKTFGLDRIDRVDKSKLDVPVARLDWISRGLEIGGIITISPLERTKTLPDKIIKSGMWPFRKSERFNQEETESSISISELNGNLEEGEIAYRITIHYFFNLENLPKEEKDKGWRPSIFIGNVLLPETISKKAFAQIEKNPAFAMEMLRALDPELMNSQKGMIERSKMDKFLIIPEGMADSVWKKKPSGRSYDYWSRGKVEKRDWYVLAGVDSNYIKTTT